MYASYSSYRVGNLVHKGTKIEANCSKKKTTDYYSKFPKAVASNAEYKSQKQCDNDTSADRQTSPKIDVDFPDFLHQKKSKESSLTQQIGDNCDKKFKFNTEKDGDSRQCGSKLISEKKVTADQSTGYELVYNNETKNNSHIKINQNNVFPTANSYSRKHFDDESFSPKPSDKRKTNLSSVSTAQAGEISHVSKEQNFNDLQKTSEQAPKSQRSLTIDEPYNLRPSARRRKNAFLNNNKSDENVNEAKEQPIGSKNQQSFRKADVEEGKIKETNYGEKGSIGGNADIATQKGNKAQLLEDYLDSSLSLSNLDSSLSLLKFPKNWSNESHHPYNEIPLQPSDEEYPFVENLFFKTMNISTTKINQVSIRIKVKVKTRIFIISNINYYSLLIYFAINRFLNSLRLLLFIVCNLSQ